MSYEITEEAQIAADYTKAVSRLVEDREEWIDSYHPEYEKMPRELSKTNVLNSSRSVKSMSSDFSGGINRTVTLYDNTGKKIKSWHGKFDIESNDQEVFFDDAQGKRVIIQGGIVVSEED